MNIQAPSPAAVPPSAGAPTEAPSAPAPPSQELGKDEFLRLLVAQLSNQDPLNPLEGHEFAAQLAQFSSVEQLVGVNEALAQQAQMSGLLAQSVNSSVAAGLIGKTVEAEGSTVQWDGTGEVTLGFELGAPSSGTVIEVRDEAGTLVRTIKRGGYESGTHKVAWDGNDDDGNRAAEGTYSFEVKAQDPEGEPVDVRTYLRGHVDRIQFGQGGITLWIGETSVPISAVLSVEEG